MEIVRRPAARVVCLDTRRRLLLLKWRDPADGSIIWEPPGGGLEPGEDPIDTARRELEEETGLPGRAVVDRSVLVERDVGWNGRRYRGHEAFFLARVDSRPTMSRARLEDWEAQSLLAQEWLAWPEVLGLTDPVEPPQLAGVLAAFDPGGPWAENPRVV